jgi:hypothetical protein
MSGLGYSQAAPSPGGACHIRHIRYVNNGGQKAIPQTL